MKTNDVAQIIQQWVDLSTTRSMHDMRRFIQKTDLSPQQFTILMRLYHHDLCAFSDISKHMGVTSAAVSQVIERLVDKQLIERSEDPNDRRAKNIILTEKGHDLVETCLYDRYHWVGELAEKLGSDEQEAVLKALPALIEAFKNLDVHEE